MKKQLLIILSLLYVIPLFAQVPTISSFTPKRGGVGTTISITGTNFSTTPANNIVYFGGVKSPVLSATSTTLTVKVPYGASYKRISVTTNNLTAWTRENFLPTFAGTGTIDVNTLAENVDFAGITGTENKIEVVDIDGDGKPDVVTGSGSTVYFYRNTSTSGSISTSLVTETLGSGNVLSDFTFSDVDADGKKDLVCVYSTVITTFNGQTMRDLIVGLTVYINQSTQGTITFATPLVAATIPVNSHNCNDVNDNPTFSGFLECGDLNADGKEDFAFVSNEYHSTCGTPAVVANNHSETTLFQNLGNMSFSISSLGETGFLNRGSALTIANINTDSKPEVIPIQSYYTSVSGNYVLTSSGQVSITIFRNISSTGGAFAFTNGLYLGYGTSGAQFAKVKAVDFDLDNKNDLYINGAVRQNNVSSAIFDINSLGTEFYVIGGGYADFCDVNGDGSIDICKHAAALVGLLPNIHTSGVLATTSFGTSTDFSTYGGNPVQIACNDIDMDGKPDIIFINSGGYLSIMRNQTPSTGAILTLGTLSAGLGSSAVVPVTATTLNGIEGFQFTIQYDQTKLSYQNCSDWDAGVNSANVLVTNNSSAGTITFVYNDNAFSIASGTFFKINFNVIAGTTSTTPVTWSDTPTPREFINAIPNLIDVTYNNGTVNIVNSLYSISGTITYDNISNTPMGAITVELLDNSSNIIATTTTNASGQYVFGSIANGNYTVRPSTVKPWGGATSLDITLYKKHIGSVPGFIMTGIRLGSGDPNLSTTLTSLDLTLIRQRIGAQINSFTSGDWLFESGAVTVSSANLTKNIKAICYGDANGSNNP
jgi:hypothetical protein